MPTANVVISVPLQSVLRMYLSPLWALHVTKMAPNLKGTFFADVDLSLIFRMEYILNLLFSGRISLYDNNV